MVPQLAWAHCAPDDLNALGLRQAAQRLCRVQTKNCAGRIAFDDEGAAALAIRRRVGHRDPLNSVGDGEIGRDVAAGSDAEITADLRRALGNRKDGERDPAAFGIINQAANPPTNPMSTTTAKYPPSRPRNVARNPYQAT